MCKRIKDKIRNGSIILMHNDTKYTASGLQKIIDTIHECGYEIVPLKELVYEDNYETNHESRQIRCNNFKYNRQHIYLGTELLDIDIAEI